MKHRSVFLLFFSLVFAVESNAATASGGACGDNRVKFEVTTEKAEPVPPSPDAGKALIIFVQMDEGSRQFAADPTTLFGVDGRWVGANQGNSYFALPVAPGEHHVCADWGKRAEVATVTAEPGKVYYYLAKTVTDGEDVAQGGRVRHRVVGQSLELVALSEDEGKYRVKVSERSLATQRR
jgi:hypothetical protein